MDGPVRVRMITWLLGWAFFYLTSDCMTRTRFTGVSLTFDTLFAERQPSFCRNSDSPPKMATVKSAKGKGTTAKSTLYYRKYCDRGKLNDYRSAAKVVAKAKTAKKAALQGVHSHSSRKTRRSVSFHRPKTLRLPRDPKYQRKSIPHALRMDEYRIIVSWVVSVTSSL